MTQDPERTLQGPFMRFIRIGRTARNDIQEEGPTQIINIPKSHALTSEATFSSDFCVFYNEQQCDTADTSVGAGSSFISQFGCARTFTHTHTHTHITASVLHRLQHQYARPWFITRLERTFRPTCGYLLGFRSTAQEPFIAQS